jgi:hypothetical protein
MKSKDKPRREPSRDQRELDRIARIVTDSDRRCVEYWATRDPREQERMPPP